MESKTYILSFSSDEATLARAGGKGSNLAALARAGFAVPPGIIITTDAYCAFVRANGLEARILELARHVSPDDLTALDNASAEIRALFERGSLPADVAADITSAYRGLATQRSNHPTSQPPVAVRSSATAEDLPGLAFAGQQDTYLNVSGEPAVLDAVKKCWGSLWTARAMAYRARNHIPPDDIALAVVVQEMVPSVSSGVAFTANPVTGRRDEIVIDASFGLGEAIVSGQVDPDHYVVDPNNWKIAQCRLGAKELAILPAGDQGTRRVEQDRSREQALPDEQIEELAKTAGRAAEHFGMPQDIEWAWADRRLVLLQSRPITSLYPLPAAAAEGVRVYVNFNFTQGVTDPLTPLGVDVVRLIATLIYHTVGVRGDMEQLAPEAGDRLFLDFTVLLGDPRLRSVAYNFLAGADPAARQIVMRQVQEGRIPTQRVLTPRRVLTLLRGVAPLVGRALGALFAPEKARERAFASADKFLAQVKEHVATAKDLEARLSALKDDVTRSEAEVGMAAMPSALIGNGLLQVVDDWLTRWLGEKPGTALQLTRGLPHNVTTEMDLKLWAAALAIRADPAAAQALRTQPVQALAETFRHGQLPAAAQRALADFMNAYGMRGDAEIDIGRSRWRDDPTPILHTVQSYLEIRDPNQAPDVVFRRGADHAERLAAEYRARVRRKRFGWLRARLLGGAIRRIRVLGVLREVPLFYLVQVIDLYRTALLDSGGELTAQGKIERPEDIFFVPLGTLRRFGGGEQVDLKATVASNRTEYARELARRPVPRVLLSTGEAFYEGVTDSTATGDELAGEAVSPGIAEGRVRVILDPHGARLEPGEILVCPSTNPGWTPLFLTAGGLVMEMGGMITHGSVVAREYGLPAVVGVHNATSRLKTGERVRVDGSRGRVILLDEAEPKTAEVETPA